MFSRFSLSFFALLALGLFAYQEPLFSASPKNASAAIELDLVHASALWHSLNRTKADDSELAALFWPNGFTDEFDKRKKLRQARDKYGRAQAVVKAAKIFRIDFAETVGKYDFEGKGYPLDLYRGDSTYVVPGNRGLYRAGDRAENGRGDVNESIYRAWYSIPDEMRFLKVSEMIAEACQPRINANQGTVVLTMELKALSAEEVSGPDGSGILRDSIRLRNTYFEVTRFSAKVRSESIWGVDTKKAPLSLGVWTPSKKKKADLPNMEGTWNGKAEFPEREIGGVIVEGPGSAEYVLNIRQSRAVLSGNFRSVRTFGANPLGRVPSPEVTEGELEGEIDKNGKFNFGPRMGNTKEFEGHLVGDEILGKTDCYSCEVNFKMVRGESPSSGLGTRASNVGLGSGLPKVDGLWHGTYNFNGARVEFEAELKSSGSTFEGTITDNNDSPMARVFSGTIDASGNVVFIKKYESEAPEVTYKGVLGPDGSITGEWAIDGGAHRGDFVMKKD